MALVSPLNDSTSHVRNDEIINTTSTVTPTVASSSKPSPNTSPALSPVPDTMDITTTTTTTTGTQIASVTSQPMRKSLSDDSHSSSKDASGGPTAYGTRSRNRNGQNRPNYAEDKDLDTELFDAPLSEKKSIRLTNVQAAEEIVRNGPSARKPLPTGDAKSSNAINNTRDRTITPTAPASAIGTNGSSSAPTTNPSKKRKAATGASANQTPNGIASAAANAPPRRARDSTALASTNMVSFDDHKCMLTKDGKMIADDGTVFGRDDHIYIICEPPGEPYYIARIVDWVHVDGDRTKPVHKVVCNWFYRPRDMGKAVQDTRVLFASMHKDDSPLTSIRGKCTIKHKSEFANLDEYRKIPDAFWFDKLYDRYIMKYYDIIPTSQIVNVPEPVKVALNECWRYVFFEQGRGKELTGAAKSCKRCSNYCASNDSVDCAVCHNTYHMNCISPPLLKKPSRGFAWSCAACSRAQERKLQARHAPNVLDPNGVDMEDEEMLDEEEDDHARDTNRTTPDNGRFRPPTASQAEKMSLWPWRYLGVHCKPEDALDYDDHIEPRAGSRLGNRHQAGVLPWFGRPVEYVKAPEFKKGKKDSKQWKEAQAAMDAYRLEKERRPKWIQDEPPGYTVRGEDFPEDDPRNTSRSLWKPVEVAIAEAEEQNDKQVVITEAAVDAYMDKARSKSKALGLPVESVNLQDVAEYILRQNNYDSVAALKELGELDKPIFREPDLTVAEIKKFEDGVMKFGSDLHAVWKNVKSVSKTVFYGDIVRYYYKWKKTDKGQQIWGGRTGRKAKKEAKEAKRVADETAHLVLDDVADIHDDSAFDAEKAERRKKTFVCRFCNTKHSRQWRRAPNIPPVAGSETVKSKDKTPQPVTALCRRCAELWRRYAIQWEDRDEINKKLARDGGRGWKRKIDEELLKELLADNERTNSPSYDIPNPAQQKSAAAAAAAATPATSEPPKKKLKGLPEPDAAEIAAEAAKKKAAEKPAPPPVPEIPKPKIMPCAVCLQIEPMGDQHVSCKECRMTVHRSCYGIVDSRNGGKWTCEMCANDKNAQVSTRYKCVLCPIERIEHDFVEPPKTSHKKKTEKDRERERLEREAAFKAADYYRKRQEELGRPVNPFEPLKKTADNNWVHVTCAVWHSEVKFANAKAMEPCEGISSISRSRYSDACKVCKTQDGACVQCHQCKVMVHVECAHQQGYTLGFDITPVKGSRRADHSIVNIGGETGTMSALLWCKEHIIKTIVHPIHEIVDDAGTTALQLFVQNFKQADLTLTGCARKANLISQAAAKMTTAPAVMHPATRRASLVNGVVPATCSNHSMDDEPAEGDDNVCLTCGVGISLRWYPINDAQAHIATNGHFDDIGAEARKFLNQRTVQCHKCWKQKRQPKPPPTMKREPTPQRDLHLSALQSLPPMDRPTEREHHNYGGDAYWEHPRSPTNAPTVMNGHPPMPTYPMAPQHNGVPPPPSQTFAPPPRPQGGGTYTPGAPMPYSDWQRPSSEHGPPPMHPHMNGHTQGPPSALAPPNHLRPPPPPQQMSGVIAQPPPPPPPAHASMINGHMAQPMVNGMPPSPRHMNGGPPQSMPASPLTNGTGYMQHSYPPPPPPPPSGHQPNGHAMPPQSRGPEPAYAQPPYQGQSPFSSQQGSPPSHREIVISRESGLTSPSGRSIDGRSIDGRSIDGRSANDASANPSLRNLLH